ncbi:MAG: hypothetical protein AB7G12_09635 [Thermoanaerobaculia bacterium]
MTLEQVVKAMLAIAPELRASPDVLFPVVLELYGRERIDRTAIDEDGDMLLFQWGVFDWGDGRRFEIDLSRQAIIPEDDDEEADQEIQQLRCTFRYEPEQFEELLSGNRWCQTPDDLDAFRAFVLGSEALRRASLQTAVELRVLCQAT